jgi:hypothetical protein
LPRFSDNPDNGTANDGSFARAGFCRAHGDPDEKQGVRLKQADRRGIA